jgi:hypothetical protein
MTKYLLFAILLLTSCVTSNNKIKRYELSPQNAELYNTWPELVEFTPIPVYPTGDYKMSPIPLHYQCDSVHMVLLDGTKLYLKTDNGTDTIDLAVYDLSKIKYRHD